MDIALGIVLVIAAAVLMFFAGRACGGLKPQYVPDLIALAAVGAVVAHALWGRDSVLLARVLPFSNLLVLSNLFAPLAGLLAGLMWEKKATPTWRRVIYVGGLAAATAYSIAAPFAGPAPACSDQWENGVCMQTTSATCSAACGATVLKAHGIETSEEELAAFCFTRKGTLWQAEDLRQLTPGPVILTVGIPGGSNVDPIYTERYRWTPGTLHSVVLYDFAENDRVNMGDPSIGREQWTVEDLRVLYRGKGLRLVAR